MTNTVGSIIFLFSLLTPFIVLFLFWLRGRRRELEGEFKKDWYEEYKKQPEKMSEEELGEWFKRMTSYQRQRRIVRMLWWVLVALWFLLLVARLARL